MKRREGRRGHDAGVRDEIDAEAAIEGNKGIPGRLGGPPAWHHEERTPERRLTALPKKFKMATTHATFRSALKRRRVDSLCVVGVELAPEDVLDLAAAIEGNDDLRRLVVDDGRVRIGDRRGGRVDLPRCNLWKVSLMPNLISDAGTVDLE